MGGKFLCGNNMTLADIFCFVWLMPCFQTVLDAGFRKGQKKMNVWAEAMCANDQVKKIFGNVQMCAKALKPACQAAAPKKEKKADKPKEEKKEKPAAPVKKLDNV